MSTKAVATSVKKVATVKAVTVAKTGLAKKAPIKKKPVALFEEEPLVLTPSVQTSTTTLSVTNYPYLSWAARYPDHTVDITALPLDKSWASILDQDEHKEAFKKINRYLTHCLTVTDGKVKIYPYPDLIFNGLNVVPLNKIKVCILGQDPYHGHELLDNGETVPQAMGLSFSVPIGVPVPSSLQNINKNLVQFNRIKKLPEHGNLSNWSSQGCLLLNATLTVQHQHPNSHKKFWTSFTDAIIKYISDNTEKTVFVFWGNSALEKLSLIDTEKHKTVISSHPSGLSCSKPMGKYKSFMDQDHFGIINKYLVDNGKEPIDWSI